jgi:CubicO group peptidase (beta-lactamase class C family)
MSKPSILQRAIQISVPVTLKYLLPAVMLLFQSGCTSKSPTEIPSELQDGWALAEPAAAGFNEVDLGQLTQRIKEGEFPNTHAVLIEHDRRLIYEQYFEGTDERWGEPIGHQVMNRNSVHDLRSVSKSVTSAVLGIALGADYEEALKKPVSAYFPEAQAGPEWQAVTLHHALTMTAGIEWNEMTVPYTDEKNDELQLYGVEDPVGLVLARPVRETPGTVWYYNGGLSQVLAGIVQQITGRSLDSYADEVLFKPLGITNYEWLGEPSWDPPMPSAASGLRMQARDLAKIGSLYLHSGRWAGRQVVPQEWVERSMQRHVEEIAASWSSGGIWGYGYQWWHGRFSQGYTAVAAVGNGNQRIFVLPEERIVVTIFAGEYNKFEGHSDRILHRIMAAR